MSKRTLYNSLTTIVATSHPPPPTHLCTHALHSTHSQRLLLHHQTKHYKYTNRIIWFCIGIGTFASCSAGAVLLNCFFAYISCLSCIFLYKSQDRFTQTDIQDHNNIFWFHDEIVEISNNYVRISILVYSYLFKSRF